MKKLLLLVLFGHGIAHAQSPNRPIRLKEAVAGSLGLDFS
jgi:hypothetical protein